METQERQTNRLGTFDICSIDSLVLVVVPLMEVDLNDVLQSDFLAVRRNGFEEIVELVLFAHDDLSKNTFQKSTRLADEEIEP